MDDLVEVVAKRLEFAYPELGRPYHKLKWDAQEILSLLATHGVVRRADDQRHIIYWDEWGDPNTKLDVVRVVPLVEG